MIAALLSLAACGAPAPPDDAGSGGSVIAIPAQQQALIGGELLVSPGATGVAEAQAFARQICAGYHLEMRSGGVATVDGLTHFAYDCL